ncbi:MULTISPECIES: hypothetical protein [unclassified Burkholderia]|uniref:hypothetical protein n=1 Tax=unclassified Burkholderia TaxID=2613784 RepID=UPI002AB02FC3|nr:MULTISPECIES: hypothetical protein [unclassified Burkholderia]
MQRVSGEIELKRVAGHLRDGIDLHASMPPPISSDGEQHRGKGCMEPANMCELAVTHLRCTERPLQEAMASTVMNAARMDGAAPARLRE